MPVFAKIANIIISSVHCRTFVLADYTLIIACIFYLSTQMFEFFYSRVPINGLCLYFFEKSKKILFSLYDLS